MELLDYMVTLCLITWGTTNYFPQWLLHFVFPPVVYKDSNFPISELLIFLLFDSRHLNGCKVVSHCISLITQMMSRIFSYVYWPFVYLFGSLFRSFVHFLIELFDFLLSSYTSCIYILDINPLPVWFANIFSHSKSSFFILLTAAFSEQNLF